jgi:hypothetical protein
LAAKVTDELSDEWSSEVFEPEADEPVEAPAEGFSEDSVRLYLREIGRVKMIKPDEEIELARRIAKGDGEAKKKLDSGQFETGYFYSKKICQPRSTLPRSDSGRQSRTDSCCRKV